MRGYRFKTIIAKTQRKMRTRRFLSELEAVKGLKPVDTDSGRSDVAIGFLTCSRHLLLMMLAAKSFYHFSGIICPLYVWDDGTLRPEDLDCLRNLFPNARLLRRSDLNVNLLKDYPLTRDFARCRLKNYETYAPMLKILGPLASPNTPRRFILSDSDAFFFDWPQTILEWLDESRPTSHYIAPWSGQDNVSEEDLKPLYETLGISLCPRINSGLLLLDRSIFRLDIIEKILSFYSQRSYAWDIEQTIYRFLMAVSNSVPLNQDDYVLCHRKFNAVCHHFFSSVISDEPVIMEKIVNLLAYIEDCERREKPPVAVAQGLRPSPPPVRQGGVAETVTISRSLFI